MPAASETLFVTLDQADHRRLVKGLLVTHSVSGWRVDIRLEGVTARQLIEDVLKAMGDDPPEAKELLPRRRNNHRRRGGPGR